MKPTIDSTLSDLSLKLLKEQLLHDYRCIVLSRACSVLGRKEALMGKAKFGIFGDGKELPQLVLSRFFQPGRFSLRLLPRSDHPNGARSALTPTNICCLIYAHLDLEVEPMSGGRQMGAHFVTAIDEEETGWI